MSAADDDRVAERLRALADHARTEPERTFDDLGAVSPFRVLESRSRTRVLRAGVLVGVAAACAVLALAVRRAPTDESGDRAVSPTMSTVSRASSTAPVTTAPTAASTTAVVTPSSTATPPTATSTSAATTTPTTSESTTTSAAAPPEPTVPLSAAATPSSPFPDAAVLGSVAAVDGNQVTWSVRCGVRQDGGAVEATTVRLPLALSTVTADTGTEGTNGSVVLDVATWATTRTAGLWWVTVQNGRVTNIVSSRLVTTRCV